MTSVWIIDDDQSIRWVLEKALGRASIPVRSFAQGSEVLAALKAGTPSVLVTDIRMPGVDGLSLLYHVKQAHPALPVIVMTAFTDLGSTVEAFQKGAFDYLPKPFDVNAAVALIQRALQTARDELDRIATEQQREGGAPHADRRVPRLVSKEADAERIMLHSSAPAMQEVFRAIGRLASSNVTVLITGESGTGKELIARALHEHSARSKQPFVALNTAAIPKDLLEAELFGHERGAFTGATQQRRGRFEEARQGTLFLDEIGDMPFDLQTRLLRVLAEGSFYRVGGSQPIEADVRIVAATHQPLEQRVAEGRFREDLFHRLNVIRLRLPPLRERTADIAALVDRFMRNSAKDLGVAQRRLTPEALDALIAFDFPGNIRQLENFCQWLTVMSPGQLIEVKDLPPEVLSHAVPLAQALTDAAPANHASDDWLHLLSQEAQARLARNEPAIMAAMTRQFESVLIEAALAQSRGRRIEAAQRLGIGRNTLTRKCAELGLE
ncbi:nitrogen regulation protein NR(I) [Allopusillimonas ginsengisoli]|uniref:nitrogen regulation protein NR(I) n=1 Tax=Allopusillimonas ginsengisoli TaxID=453575 RepID=UPI0010C16985|nr:nitrogen regulation protein NR(I) [Allopusillimonas ginsengisoli]